MKTWHRRWASVATLCGAIVAATHAFAADPIVPAASAASAVTDRTAETMVIRPRVVLVLSGGGARGLAHIGVLKVLRELRIPVDVIVGTSMGSIVGGAYAAGNTPEQMEALVGAADWDAMFADRAPREYLSFRRKEDDLRFIGKSELGIKRDGIVFPRGAFGAQALEDFLRLVAKPANDARHLDALPIPLRAVATDMVTGRMIVLADVPLSTAMRASMSIPGAFAPTNFEGRLLGDGGLTRNLPIEVARDLAPDVIIAVNVGTPLLPREGLNSAFGVAQQMINILTEQNVANSIEAMTSSDILISPDLTGYTFVDFEKGTELIARGEAAARDVADRLQRLSADPRWYASWEAGRARTPEPSTAAVVAIETRGALRTNPVTLKAEIERRAGIAVGERVTDAQLVEASQVLYGMGEFERVEVKSEMQEGQRVIVVDVGEKPWGPNYLRIGGRGVSDADTDARFSITVQHTRTWINSWGAEWRNEVQVGDVRRFMSAFYQPLGPASRWFVEPTVETITSDSDIFTSGNHRTDRITRATSSVSTAFGARIGNTGVAELRVGHEWYRTTPAISSRLEGTVTDTGNYARVSVTFDSLDDANFPRHGYLVNGQAGATRYNSSNETVRTYSAQAQYPVTFGRLTLLGLAAAGYSVDDKGGFALGGFLNLSGTPVGAVSGSQAATLAGVAYYRMGELPRALGKSWSLGMSLEAGNVWPRWSDVRFGDLRKAGSVFVGMDSIIGPLYLGWGHTFGGDSAVYLFLGRPTDHN